MKINITMESTPAELREFLGLTEVRTLQAEMIETIREQMKAGVEGFDPLSMMRPFIAPNLQSYGGDAARIVGRPLGGGDRSRESEAGRLTHPHAGRCAFHGRCPVCVRRRLAADLSEDRSPRHAHGRPAHEQQRHVEPVLDQFPPGRRKRCRMR